MKSIHSFFSEFNDKIVLARVVEGKFESYHLIDHFHKWRPLLHSFVLMLIRPTALVLKQIFF